MGVSTYRTDVCGEALRPGETRPTLASWLFYQGEFEFLSGSVLGLAPAIGDESHMPARSGRSVDLDRYGLK